MSSVNQVARNPPRSLLEAEVRAGVARLLGSDGFRNSPRMCRFLTFVVERHLAGDTSSLKESIIGVSVYDRAASYDPKVDPVVRNEARRLRSKLEEYYLGPGRDDSCRISLPKGGYIPSFEQQVDMGSATPVFDLEPPPIPPSRPGHSPEYVQPRPRLPRAAVFALVASVMAVLTLGFRSLRRDHASRPPDVAESGHIAPITSMGGRSDYPSISPDGHAIIFSRDRGDGYFNLYLVQPGGGPPQRLTNTRSLDLTPSWSPDGRLVAFERIGPELRQVMVKDLRTGGEQLIASLGQTGRTALSLLNIHTHQRAAWTHDGTALIFPMSNEPSTGVHLIRQEIASGSVTPVTRSQPAIDDFEPAISPDGQWVAFLRSTSFESTDVYLVKIDGSEERRLTSVHANMQGLAWYPDGEHLLVSSNQSGMQLLWRLDLQNGLMRMVPTSGESAIDPSISKDGRLIAYVDEQLSTEIVRVPLGPRSQAATPEILAPSSRQSDSAQISPDGLHVAFVSNRGGSWELWMVDRDGAQLRQLTHFGGSMVGSPRWSPDGRQIAFDARPDGHASVYLIAAEGGEPRHMDESRFEEKQPNWSLDGEAIYFVSNRDGNVALWSFRLADGRMGVVARGACLDPKDDGVGEGLFLSDRSGTLMHVGAQTSADKNPVSLGITPAGRLWAAMKNGVYFVTSDMKSISFLDTRKRIVSSVSPVPSSMELGTPSLSISPDRKFALMSRQKQVEDEIMLIGGSPAFTSDLRQRGP